MNSLEQWMCQTRAEDLMTREIVSFSPQETLADVAGQLLDHQISGGPVVKEGRCIGVFSANDLVTAEDKVTSDRAEFAQSGFWDAGLTLPVQVYEEKLSAVRAKIAPVANQTVERFMTTDVVHVTIGNSLSEVVQKMVDAHVHRVVVLDDRQHLVGLISTMDVMSYLLNNSTCREGGQSKEVANVD